MRLQRKQNYVQDKLNISFSGNRHGNLVWQHPHSYISTQWIKYNFWFHYITKLKKKNRVRIFKNSHSILLTYTKAIPFVRSTDQYSHIDNWSRPSARLPLFERFQSCAKQERSWNHFQGMLSPEPQPFHGVLNKNINNIRHYCSI